MSVGSTADRIELRGLRFLASHGVYDFEKKTPQPFEVDLDLFVDLRAAGSSDALGDTVSYADVVEVVGRIFHDEQYDLIERLAARVAEDLLRDHRIESVDVTVRKLRPALAADLGSSAVRIRRP